MAVIPKEFTLVFLVIKGQVWLAKKTRVLGIGLYNGYGGGIKPGETKKEAVLRELDEETGHGVIPDPTALEKVAMVDFHSMKDGKPLTMRVHVYILTRWEGSPKPTSEMIEPKLFPISDLPLNQMMLADREWVPLVLAGEKIKAEFWYNQERTELLRPLSLELISRFED